LGDDDNKSVELQLKKDGQWESAGHSQLDTDAWVATFRIANWNERAATPYKLVYREKHLDGTETVSDWSGTIKANPSG
jgi:alkaline phosphatase D